MIYIKEGLFQFSDLYLPGFSRASSKESKRTLVVPERSLGG
jgi:hypothetical protein